MQQKFRGEQSLLAERSGKASWRKWYVRIQNSRDSKKECPTERPTEAVAR